MKGPSEIDTGRIIMWEMILRTGTKNNGFVGEVGHLVLESYYLSFARPLHGFNVNQILGNSAVTCRQAIKASSNTLLKFPRVEYEACGNSYGMLN